MVYETPAFLAAATNAGRSCVSQRTDVLGSGSRKQTSPPACALLWPPWPPATAPLTVVATPTTATASTTTNLVTDSSSGGWYRREATSSFAAAQYGASCPLDRSAGGAYHRSEE